VSGLGSLFKRGGKKEETQQVVIVVNDKPSGELSFDVTQPCAALRKKLATTKIVRKKKKKKKKKSFSMSLNETISQALPKQYVFTFDGSIVRPPDENTTRVCDIVTVGQDQKALVLVLQVDNIDAGQVESKSTTASEAAASSTSPRGRPQLKRTKAKGGAELEAVNVLNEHEAIAYGIEVAVRECGGTDTLAAGALRDLARAVIALIKEKAASLRPNDKELPEVAEGAAAIDVNATFWAPSIAEAVAKIAASKNGALRAQSTEPAGRGPYRAVAQDDQGQRKYMEDKWTVAPQLGAMFGIDEPVPTYFYGVYDGHTGKLAAEYARTHLHAYLARHPDFATDLPSAIEAAFKQTDAEFNKHAARFGLKDGTTAVTLVLRGTKMYVHWCGDSEATLCHRSRSLKLCEPHSPSRQDEKERIQAAGGTVVWFGTWRVNGTLGVARSIGDSEHASCVIAQPDFIERDINPNDSFVMLATDGLFDVIKHEDAVKFTVHWVNSPQRDPDDICKAIVGEAMRRKTKDNVTAMFIFFKRNPLPKVRPQRTAHPKVPTAEAPVPPQDEYDAARA
jgi:serine/threonine protein phosphatase PrpC